MVTRGRKVPIDKAAGRNESEPRSSLVNKVKMPTLWTQGEGRSTLALTTEMASLIFRGTRDGMLWKLLNPVLETRYGDVEDINRRV